MITVPLVITRIWTTSILFTFQTAEAIIAHTLVPSACRSPNTSPIETGICVTDVVCAVHATVSTICFDS